MSSFGARMDALERAAAKELPKDDRIVAFFDSDSVREALAARSWDVREEVETLVGIARGSRRDADRMQAIRQLREVVRESAELSGIIVRSTDTVTRSPDGTLTASSSRNVSRLADATRRINAASQEEPQGTIGDGDGSAVVRLPRPA